MSKMKIVYNPFIPFPGFSAMNLFGIVFVRSEFKGKIVERVINHESIHTKQMLELGILPFYIIYFFEWIVRLFMKGNAYRNISFEQEAYGHEHESDYLSKRKHYTWLTYWKKQK